MLKPEKSCKKPRPPLIVYLEALSTGIRPIQMAAAVVLSYYCLLEILVKLKYPTEFMVFGVATSTYHQFTQREVLRLLNWCGTWMSDLIMTLSKRRWMLIAGHVLWTLRSAKD